MTPSPVAGAEPAPSPGNLGGMTRRVLRCVQLTTDSCVARCFIQEARRTEGEDSYRCTPVKSFTPWLVVLAILMSSSAQRPSDADYQRGIAAVTQRRKTNTTIVTTVTTVTS